MRLLGFAPQCYYSFYLYALNNLDEVRDELIKVIENSLGLRVYPPEELRIVLVSVPIRRSPTAIVRGGYDPITKTIFLSDRTWCRKTFIHELLHAVSYFSRVPELFGVFNREYEFVEGLTEFLTGYVLYSRYSNCYAEWISKRYLVCSISYERYVRLFGALAHMLIPISDLIKLFVYDPNIDWFDEYNRFLNRYGLEDFLINKPKKKRKIPLETLLEDMVVKVLREKVGEEKVEQFRELRYEAPLDVVLDYSNMM